MTIIVFILGAFALLFILGAGASLLTSILALFSYNRKGWSGNDHHFSRPPKSAPGWKKNSGGPRNYT